MQCTDCNLVYLKTRPAVSELGTIYPSSYYQYNEFLGSWVTRIRSLVQRGRVKPIARYAPADAFIVEVGCGNGELLRVLKRYGDPSWRLMGVDFAKDACRYVERLGIEAICDRFETMSWSDRGPDVILMNQVIEHLEDPAASVRKASELLRPGGVLIVETPSIDAWDRQLFGGQYWGGWHCPRHWNLYEPRTLRQLFERHGLAVIETTFLLSPYIWAHTLHNIANERYGLERLSSVFSERVIPTLALVSAIDVVQRAARGRTSNMRMVGQKPQ